MNLENSNKFKPNYIKLDLHNKIKLKNKLDIKEEESDLKTIIESFEQQVTLEELNSFIYKFIPKNTNNLFKINLEQSKHYKKHFPFNDQNIIESIRRILATDYKSNFIFNNQNLEDVSRVLTYIFESLKKYNITNENILKERIKNIKLNIHDIFNMFIDIDMMNEKKSERNYRLRNKLKLKFYANQNPIYFNSTGNLPTVHELNNEENFDDNNDDGLTINKKNKNNLYNIYSSSSENDDDNDGDNNSKKEGSNKIKKMFKKIKQKSIGLMEDIYNKYKKNMNKLNKKNNNLFTEDNKIVVTKEYFIYPENNYGLQNDKLELPIELIILIKKFEKIKILTFQIRDVDKKSLKENIFLLFNINLLFPNFTEIKIDLNDEKLQIKINNLYEIRTQDLLNKFKKDLRIFQYKQDYQCRTVNCWEPEGDIKFIEENDDENDIKYKYTSFGNNYILGENPFENSNYFGNNLKNIISGNDNNYNNILGKNFSIKYIMPIKQVNKSFLNKDSYNEYDEEESDDISLQSNRISLRTYSEFPKFEKNKTFAPIIRNRSTSYLDPDNKSTINKISDIETNSGKKKRKKTTPELLSLFIKDNETPFEMIIIYCWFLDKILKIKTLSLYFYDSYSLETEFFLRNEQIRFDGFHFLFFINKLKELNEVNFSFNSLDTRSFENILGLIELNKNISKLRINFFTPDINFDVPSLLKICSLMKMSLQALFREQRNTYINEKEPKDLEMEYFILNHKLDYYFEKNICCLFNIIKKNININNYEEIVFRFDLPLLILSCDKYLIIIIKFIANMLNLITFTKNKINIFKLISPELILDGRITPSLRNLFKELNLDENINKENNINENININEVNKEFGFNDSLKEITLQCKIFGIPNIFNIFLYNNISGLIYISIGDLDLESFNGFLYDYKKHLDKMTNLNTLKIGLSNIIISYEEVEDKMKEFIDINSVNLKAKILYSHLELGYIDKINDLRKYVQKTKIEKIVVQIGSNNNILLNSCEYNENEKNRIELESLYYIMTKQPYNLLIKDKIIKNLRRYFKKNKEKIVICRPYFSSFDL